MAALLLASTLLPGLLPLAAASIVPSVNSTVPSLYNGTLPLLPADGTKLPIADIQLVPLTRGAAQHAFNGSLVLTTPDTATNLTANAFAYISCNPDDYPGNIGAQALFELVFNSNKLAGVLLYSAATDYCGYSPGNNQDTLLDFPVLSMTNANTSAILRDALKPRTALYQVFVQPRNSTRNTNGSPSSGTPSSSLQNPLGPSPSTAVANVILNSITGIITALFLFIIVTGAIRAHRHPERYGPRNVSGGPRQSRARGLGRAILDTIPIVKFGDKESPKVADVELATATAPSPSTDNAAHISPEVSAESTHAKSSPKPSTDRVKFGIAPAVSAQVAADVAAHDSSHNENLGCSICTEDFENGQDLRVLPCNHKFHPECVDPWLLNVSGTCPLCRVDLHPINSQNSSASHFEEDIDGISGSGADTVLHRRSAFLAMLSLRSRPQASVEERISTLRRLRELRIPDRPSNQVSVPEGSIVDMSAPDSRRAVRLSSRLSEVIGGWTRRTRRDLIHAQNNNGNEQALARGNSNGPVM